MSEPQEGSAGMDDTRTDARVRQVRPSWIRLFAEFFTVFVGVVGALLADDWRERRSERRTAREAIEQIEADLRLDSAEFVALDESVRGQEHAAAWLLMNLGRPDVPVDSVTQAMTQTTVGRLFQPAGPSYRSLRDGGNLHLLEDASLRGEIVRYYEDTQVYLGELYALSESVARDVELRLVPYRGRLPDRESLDFGPESRWILVGRPSLVAQDRELLNVLGLFGGRAAFVAARLEQLFIPENARMLARVRESLDGS